MSEIWPNSSEKNPISYTYNINECAGQAGIELVQHTKKKNQK
jgi:hypothetical protein